MQITEEELLCKKNKKHSGGHMNLRQIARAGMKGRRKDAFLLNFVITLSFLFIVISVVFHASSEHTKQTERIKIFGEWDTAFFMTGKEIVSDLKENEDVKSLGVSRILGTSEKFGTVGTFDESLLSLAHFSMYEGRMPENENEIAVELGQLSYLGDVKVGDMISVEFATELISNTEENSRKEQLGRLYKEYPDYMENYMKFCKNPEDESLTEEDRELFYNNIGVIDFEYIERAFEMYDTIKLRMITNYYLGAVPFEEKPDVVEIMEDGTLVSRTAYLQKEMTICGIINTYSDKWDIDHNTIANSYVTESAGEGFMEGALFLTSLADVSEAGQDYDVFVKTDSAFAYSENKHSMVEHSNNTDLNSANPDFVNAGYHNSYAFPTADKDSEETITYGVLAVIFLATVFSVFQIFLMQMKRRVKRITLMKAIGATNGQIAKMLASECMYLLVRAVPTGLVGGIGMSYVLIWILNQAKETKLLFQIDAALLAKGILLGLMAVILGMILPMIKAMHVPLIGTMNQPPKHKKRKRKQESEAIPVLSFQKINRKHVQYQKAKTALTLSLYTISITVLLVSIFLAFHSFYSYYQEVDRGDKPDYVLELKYGMRTRIIPEKLEEITSIQGVERADVYKIGEQAGIWYEGIIEEPLFQTFKEVLPNELLPDHFGINDWYSDVEEEDTYRVTEAVKGTVYALDSGDEAFSRYQTVAGNGYVDTEAFDAGEEVILLMPMYHKNTEGNSKEALEAFLKDITYGKCLKMALEGSGEYLLSYQESLAGEYAADYNIKPGENMIITVPTEGFTDDEPDYTSKTKTVKVAAIISYFPEKGIWPFSDTAEGPVVIASYKLLGSLYLYSVYGVDQMSGEELEELQKSLTPHRYGKTYFYVYEDQSVDNPLLEVALKGFAYQNEMYVTNYKEGNLAMQQKAVNSALIIGISGIAAAAIALIILYNLSLSKMEAESERIGILQSLGVTGSQFKLLYLKNGIACGLFSLAVAHIVFFAALYITSVTTISNLTLNGRIRDIAVNQLYRYPVGLHMGVCIVFFIICVSTYYRSVQTIINRQPVDNIRSLSR